MNQKFLSRFTPFEQLARQLLAFAEDAGDGSHDLSHIARVFANAMRIHSVEGGDGELLAASVLLHDCVAVEKSSPLRAQASRLAAEKACEIMKANGWPEQRLDRLYHAIEAHSFSAGIEPRTIEAQILQDADRLDALGAIGIARCFYTGGRMGSALYQSDDPAARSRELDDRGYALDHFPAKLFLLAGGFRTAEGQKLARERHDRVTQFYAHFLEEAGE